MTYEQSYLHELLTEQGRSIPDYFITGGLILYSSVIDGEPVPMALIIEDDDLMEACIDYLKDKGVSQLDSIKEFDNWVNNKTNQT